MPDIQHLLSGLEFAQVGWVVPDIHAAARVLAATMGITGFPEPQQVRAQDLGLRFRGQVQDAEWLTTQAFNGGSFLELVQPLSGRSMFSDFLDTHPAGGVQHLAFRLPEAGLDSIVAAITRAGYDIVSEVDHPIARMRFFDTTRTLGVVTEIMGITETGWKAVRQMERSGAG